MDEVSKAFERALIDEDTATWVEAAAHIGALGESAWPFIRERLVVPDDKDRRNIHQWRHIWAAVAAYLAVVHDRPENIRNPEVEISTWNWVSGGPPRQTVRLADWLGERFRGIVVEGLKRDPEVRLSDLADFPHFQELARAIQDRIRNELEQLREKGVDAAVKAKQAQLARWTDSRTTAQEVMGPDRKALPPDPWLPSSILATASPRFMQSLGIPTHHAVRALAALGRQGGDTIAYATNLPRFLALKPTGKPEERERLAALVLHVIKNLPEPDSPTHWITYVRALHRLARAHDPAAASRLTESISEVMPESIRAEYKEWIHRRDEESALAIIHACRARFLGNDRWRELPARQRLPLAVFYDVVLDPGPDAERWRVLDLKHRIRLTWSALASADPQEPEILPVLVRLLKGLLLQELRRHEGKGSLLRVAKSHLNLIIPVLERWNLRSTVHKDLATIASRVFSMYRDASQADGALYPGYLELSYKAAFVYPEYGFVKETALYAQNETVREEFEDLVTILEHPVSASLDWERERRFLEKLWAPATVAHRSRLEHLLADLTRSGGHPCEDLSDEGKRALEWMIGVRVQSELELQVDPLQQNSSSYQEELEQTKRVRVNAIVQDFETVLRRLALAERRLADVSESPTSVIAAMREVCSQLTALECLATEHLPLVERRAVIKAVRSRHDEIENRVERLSAILEGENETAAQDLYLSRDGTDAHDQHIVARWMLDRYMLKELAGRSGSFACVLDWRCVGLLILVPYALAGIIHQILLRQDALASRIWLCGLPFVLSIAVVAGLLIRSVRGGLHLPRNVSTSTLLLPQMVGVLVYGIMQSLGADETWGTGYMANPALRLGQVVIYLLASYFFVRYVMLKNQNPRIEAECPDGAGAEGRPFSHRVLRSRSLNLLSLGILQSFVLVLVFSMLQGAAMGSATRADLASIELDALATNFGQLVPHRIPLLGAGAPVALILYPWAILSWTVQIFFFSAIFERILGNR